MIKYILTALLLTMFTNIQAQKFTFSIFFIDSKNNKDTISLGYDDFATDSIDEQFGELNIISRPLSSGLDVRVTNEWWNRKSYTKTPGTYHTKKQIIKYPRNGFFNLNSIDIKTNNWPITITWDSALFNDDLRSRSFITSIPIGGWWDVGSPSNLNVQFFQDINSINFSSNVSKNYNPNYCYIKDMDTISVFWQSYANSSFRIINSFAKAINSNNKLNIYPNPSSNVLNIELEEDKMWQRIELINTLGKVVKEESFAKSLDIQSLPAGMYYLKIYGVNSRLLQTKFFKK